jgi:hypothetical protein
VSGRAGDRPAGLQAGEPGLASKVELPANARALTTLRRIDYEDAFLVKAPPAGGQSGEQWARATFEAAPEVLRRSLRRGWAALGLKLEREGAEGAILGWQLRHSGADFALLGADSRIGMPAELLFKPQGEALLFATFVQQRNPIARGVWAVVAPRHRQVVPALLGRAARRQTGSESA